MYGVKSFWRCFVRRNSSYTYNRLNLGADKALPYGRENLKRHQNGELAWKPLTI